MKKFQRIVTIEEERLSLRALLKRMRYLYPLKVKNSETKIFDKSDNFSRECFLPLYRIAIQSQVHRQGHLINQLPSCQEIKHKPGHRKRNTTTMKTNPNQT